MAKDDETPDVEEDSELTELSGKVRFDETAYRTLLKEQGISDAMIDALVAPIKGQSEVNARILQRQQARDLATYRAKLQEEFPLADQDLLTGASKRELRASAEKLQKFGERVLAAAGKKPGETTPPPDGKKDESNWVAPPANATETIREAPAVDWQRLNEKAAAGIKPEVKKEVIADIKANGPRQIQRDSFSMIAGRKAPQPAAKE